MSTQAGTFRKFQGSEKKLQPLQSVLSISQRKFMNKRGSDRELLAHTEIERTIERTYDLMTVSSGKDRRILARKLNYFAQKYPQYFERENESS